MMEVKPYNLHDRIAINKQLLTTIFRNLVECEHCGETYAIEFSLRRFMSRRDMNTQCLHCTHVQTTHLQLKYENGGPERLIDHVIYERGEC